MGSQRGNKAEPPPLQFDKELKQKQEAGNKRNTRLID